MKANTDVKFMREALCEAEKAGAKGEIPIGAVVVFEDRIIGRGHNLRETTGDPTAHAEIIALREAARCIGHWRLIGCTLYVTLEPCPMCIGAVINGRVDSTLYDLPGERKFNHHPEATGGVLEAECAALLRDFFQNRRAEQKQEKSL